jgi:Glucodextranase, domain B
MTVAPQQYSRPAKNHEAAAGVVSGDGLMRTGSHQETLRFASLVGSRHAGTWGLPRRMRIFALGVMAALAATASGCGSTTSTTTSTVGAGAVSVIVTSPTSGSVIAASNVTIRGTVNPTNATVQIQGQPAAVGNGVFTGSAALHSGKTTIDVIGSAPGMTPGSTSLTITQQSTGSSGGSSHHGSSSGGGATPGIAVERGGSSGSGGGQSSCGGGLSVGPDTTCEFAEDVQSAYRSSGGSNTVEAYSAVTNKSYEMTCVTTTTTVKCTGGVGASVYFSP